MSIPDNSTGPNGAAPLPQVSNDEFLQTVIGPDYRKTAWVASVADLTPGPQTNSEFYGGRPDDITLDPGANNYYSMAAIQDVPGASRKGVFWLRGGCLVLDDVYEKGSATDIVETLGEPSFIMQTSLGSAQFGYLLATPITDPAVMARLTRAVVIKFYQGKDPGAEPIVQYVRLPGRNTKSKRIAENGGTAPAVFLKTWHPDQKFEPVDIMMALGDAWTDAEHSARGSSRALSGRDPVSYLETDEIMQGLLKLGMLHLDKPQGSGYLQATCPLEHTHTVRDDRSGYSPERSQFGTGWKCHHTGHPGLSDHNIREYLREQLGDDAWRDIDADCHAHRLVELHANMPFTVVEDDGADDAAADTTDDAATSAVEKLKEKLLRDTPAPAKPRRYKLEWEDIGDGPVVPEEKLPAICSFAVRGAATILAAASGLGKSQFALSLAMAITADPAAEPHKFLGDTEPFRYTGDVLLIENEDAVSETKKRRHAWVTHTKTGATGRPHRVDQIKHKGFVAAEQLDRNGVVTLTPEMEALGAEIARRRQEGGDVALVIFDTANSVFAVPGENDNRAMGQVYNLLDAWSSRHDVAALIIQHVNKDSTQDGRAASQNDIRGASAQVAAVRGGAFVMRRLAPKIAEEHPGEEWVTIDNVKASYTEGSSRRVFKRVRQLIEVRDRVSGAVELTTAPVMMYDPNPPTLGPDTLDNDVLCNALGLLERAANSGAPLTAATRGGSKQRRANYVIGEAAGEDSAGGTAILSALRRKGWAETGPWANARGDESDVWRVTAEGKLALDARNADVPDIGGPAQGSASAMPAPVVSGPGPEAPRPASDTDRAAQADREDAARVVEKAKPAPRRKAAAAPQPASVPSLPEPETPAADNDDDDIWRDIAAWHDRQAA